MAGAKGTGQGALDVVEAAYRLDGDRERWLRDMVRAVAKRLRRIGARDRGQLAELWSLGACASSSSRT